MKKNNKMFNRFQEVPKNKLGFNSTFNMPMSMAEALDSAIPIWTLLGMTADEYFQLHPLQRPVKNIPEQEEEKKETEQEEVVPVEQQEEEKKE